MGGAKLLSRNPNSPGLNLEPLRGKAEGLWSFRIDQKYRGILHRNERVTTFLFVGKEEDAYRLAERAPKIEPALVPQSGTTVPDFERPKLPAMPTEKPQRAAKTSKYLPLARHLLNSAPKARFVTMTFPEVEQIVGSNLPASARKHRPWWANDASHVQAIAWLSVGWKVDEVKIESESITFALEQ
jgi:hypothetical protein